LRRTVDALPICREDTYRQKSCLVRKLLLRNQFRRCVLAAGSAGMRTLGRGRLTKLRRAISSGCRRGEYPNAFGCRSEAFEVRWRALRAPGRCSELARYGSTRSGLTEPERRYRVAGDSLHPKRRSIERGRCPCPFSRYVCACRISRLGRPSSAALMLVSAAVTIR